MRYLFLLVTICTMASCCASKNDSKKDGMGNDIVKTYAITQLFNDVVVDDNVTLTLNFKDKTLSGYSGCNNFSGSFTQENNTIKIGPLASTKKMCPDISSEDMLFKALANTEKINMNTGKLELANSSGESLLKASAIEEVQNKSQDDKITYEYKAISRGFYLTIYVSNIDDMLLVTTHPDMKPSRQTYSQEEWNKLAAEMNKLDLKNLQNIEAPSKAHQYDGAANANLKITLNENIHQTVVFDHGNPPEEIKELVNTLISFSERD